MSQNCPDVIIWYVTQFLGLSDKTQVVVRTFISGF